MNQYKYIRLGFHTMLIGEPFSSVTGVSVNLIKTCTIHLKSISVRIK